jgi:hypothetical protein
MTSNKGPTKSKSPLYGAGMFILCPLYNDMARSNYYRTKWGFPSLDRTKSDINTEKTSRSKGNHMVPHLLQITAERLLSIIDTGDNLKVRNGTGTWSVLSSGQKCMINPSLKISLKRKMPYPFTSQRCP